MVMSGCGRAARKRKKKRNGAVQSGIKCHYVNASCCTIYSCGIFSPLLICPLVVKFLWATSPSTWSCSGFFTSEDLRQHRCNLRSSQVFTNLYSIWNRPMDHSCGQKLHVLLFAHLFRHRPRSAGFEEHKGKMRSPSSQLPQIGAQEPGNNESRSLLSEAQPTVDFTARVLFAYNLHRVGQLPWALHQEVITTLLWTYSTPYWYARSCFEIKIG